MVTVGRSTQAGSVVGWAVAIGLLAAGCGGGGEKGATTGKGIAASSGSFVGKVEGLPIGVAVLVEEPAGGGQARKVSLYVCDGRSISEWLTGQGARRQVNLTSKNGKVSASVAVGGAAARGTITLADGRKLAFTAPPASGVAGLYNVTVAADGTAQGASQAGGKLAGRLFAANTVPGYGPVVATASATDQEVKLLSVARRATPGAYWWIVLPNRGVYGANRTGVAAGGVGGAAANETQTTGAQRRAPGTTSTRPIVTGNTVVHVQATGGGGPGGYSDERCEGLARTYNKLGGVLLSSARSGNARGYLDTLELMNEIGKDISDHCAVIT